MRPAVTRFHLTHCIYLTDTFNVIVEIKYLNLHIYYLMFEVRGVIRLMHSTILIWATGMAMLMMASGREPP